MAKKRALENEPVQRSRSKRTKSDSSDANIQTAKDTTIETQGRKTQHTRFGSEEYTAAPLANGHVSPRNANTGVDMDSTQDSSEDEAPEAITTSAAQRAAKETSSKVSQAVSQQRSKAKRKRQVLDSRLKAQATTSTRPRKTPTLFPDPLGTTNADDDTSQAEQKTTPRASLQKLDQLDLDAIPDLPAELLENASVSSEDFPPSEQSGDDSSNPHKDNPEQLAMKPQARHTYLGKKSLYARANPPPKDRKIGPLSVHVLARESPSLAPRGAGTAKTVRESWLAGRKGRGGKAVVPRRAVNAAFC